MRATTPREMTAAKAMVDHRLIRLRRIVNVAVAAMEL